MPAACFQHIHSDIVGPMPESHGKSYCLTVIDCVTNWLEAYPIKNFTAQTIYKEWISHYGILTDQGRQFESDLFRQFAQILCIEKWRTSP